MAVRRASVRSAAETVLPFLVLAAGWEALARLGPFPPKFFPPLSTVLDTAVHLAGLPVLWKHVGSTLARLFLGFAVAAVIGVSLGIALGRSQRAEEYGLALVTAFNPIPELAWVPLFIIWFGIGNLPTVLLVVVASSIPVILNTWTGVRSVSPLWVKVGRSFGADDLTLFRRVVLMGALPAIVAGLRLGLAQGWRAVVAGEMVASTTWGLGWMIFDARQFLQTDVMLAGIGIICLVSVGLEKGVLQPLERRTLERWGMVGGG